jgi:NAD(P)-dependent dehydrogenase (short-subunit alcohol dehydrogenase family)
MREQGSGAIVAIGARPAIHPAKNFGAYGASKAALVSLVQTIALENKDKGIRANAVLPGTMDTPTNREAMPNADPAKWVHPRDVAALLVHLASDAGAQMSGGLIPIFGSDL